MKIDATTIASLTAAMRTCGVHELEFAEGGVSMRIALPSISSPATPLALAGSPKATTDLLVVRSTAVGRFLTRHPSRTVDFAASDTVAAGEIIGVVAISGFLRSVVAPVHGRIVQRLRLSGDFVDFGTPLLELQPMSQAATR